MTYQYIELAFKTTTAKQNILDAVKILKEKNLSPAKMRKAKYDYLQTTVYFYNADDERIGFIQGNVDNEKPALLTLSKQPSETHLVAFPCNQYMR